MAKSTKKTDKPSTSDKKVVKKGEKNSKANAVPVSTKDILAKATVILFFSYVTGGF